MNDTIQLLTALREGLWQQSEQSYCDMIAVARRPESLGWEAKVKCGEFGRNELDAHVKGGELLGVHRGLAQACREIQAVIDKLESMKSDNDTAAHEREELLSAMGRAGI